MLMGPIVVGLKLRSGGLGNKIYYTDFLIYFYLFFDFVQSTRYIKQKDTSPLQGFST